MARFLKGINGAYSGKVGSVIGSHWRNVDYVRSLSKITNKKASPEQIAQRAKFAMGVAFLSPIKDLLNLGYSDKLQGKATGYNKALQFLLNNGITGTYPTLDISYADVLISKGSLSQLMGVTWTETAPRSVTVSWEARLNRFNAFFDDSVVLLMYNREKNFFSILESASRADETLTFTLPESYAGNRLEGWIFTGHREGVKTSPSVHLGTIVIS